jgi:hypothetical protein
MFADVNHDKLRTAFLAGRIDAAGERGEKIPDGVETIIRTVLGEADIKALAQCSKVLFKDKDKLRVPSNGAFQGEEMQSPSDGQGLGGAPLSKDLSRT